MSERTRQFRAGSVEGFRSFQPLSVGLEPWSFAIGVAMVGTGFTVLQAIAMNLLLFAGTAQKGI